MRFPLFVVFLPQVLISLLLGVIIIVLFAGMHETAVTQTMELSVRESLRFSEQILATPFVKLRNDVELLNQAIIQSDGYAWREDKPGGWVYNTTEYLAPYINLTTQMMSLTNNTYAFAYQTIRFKEPDPTAPPDTHNSTDFGWANTGCAQQYCFHAIDAETLYIFNEGAQSHYPYVNMSIAYNAPADYREYMAFAYTLTNSTKDREGRWWIPLMYLEAVAGQEAELLVLYTYTIPLTWDPVTGNATSVISIDMNCAKYLVPLINDLRIAATEMTIVDPATMEVVATSFTSLEPGYEPAQNGSFPRLWKPLSAPEPRLRNAMNALQGHKDFQSWSTLPREGMLVVPDDSEDIYSTRPIRVSGLNLAIVAVTRKSHYFTEGHATRRDTIIIAAVLLTLTLLITIGTVVGLRRPFDDLGRRMQKTATLEENKEGGEVSLSAIKEVAQMQEAYATMYAELKRMKSFLPQSILQQDRTLSSSDNDDVNPLDGAFVVTTNLSSGTATQLSSDLTSENETGMAKRGIDFSRLLAAPNHFTLRDSVVVQLTIAYSDAPGTEAFKQLADAMLTAVVKYASSCRGVVETMRPHFVLVSFGAHSHVGNPASSAFNFTKSLAAAKLQELIEWSAIIDRGSHFVGPSGTEELRHESLISEDLNVLASLGTFVHSTLRLQIAATNRVTGTSIDNKSVQIPAESVMWPDGSRVYLVAVFPGAASKATDCQSLASSLKLGFSRVMANEWDDAMEPLKAALGMCNPSTDPEALRLPASIRTTAEHTVRWLMHMCEARSARDAVATSRQYHGWQVADAYKSSISPVFDSSRGEAMTEAKLEMQLEELQRVKDRGQMQFRDRAGNTTETATATADRSALFEMAYQASGQSTWAGGADASFGATGVAVEKDSLDAGGTGAFGAWQRGNTVLGTGTFGEVRRALHQSGSIAAMKIVRLSKATTNIDELRKELVVATTVRHTNLVSFVDSAVTPEAAVVLMECMAGGSISSIQNEFDKLPLLVVRRFVLDTLRGLSHLHRSGIVHCDVKPQNILVGLDGTCKVADFGSAMHPAMDTEDGTGYQIRGTPAFMAPEVARGSGSTTAGDVWSVGILVHDLITGKRPFNEAQRKEMAYGGISCMRVLCALDETCPDIESLKAPPVPEIPADIPMANAVTSFIRACLQMDPSKRPTCETLLDHELFM